jgi:sulfur-carrier protein adenylyltransferase/sulfurtransferase
MALLPFTSSADDPERYSRQAILPELGAAGQARLRAGRVLVVGLGGLGSPVALYLTAAGVGTLGLADFDQVATHNLQRQILHDTPGAAAGLSKLASAEARLRALNPGVVLRAHATGLTPENAAQLVADYDVVVDAADNFATRYLLNDACVLAGRPLVHGSVFQFEGQVTVLSPHLGGPCLRCLYPAAPAEGLVPACGEAGVLGALCGVIGAAQALEALKLLVGMGVPLVGRWWHHDALAGAWRELRAARNSGCAVCGDHPTITRIEPTRYAPTCAPAVATEDEEVGSTALARAVLLVDVRAPDETSAGTLAGRGAPVAMIPLAQLATRAETEVPQAGVVVVYCARGGRSLRAVRALRARGWANVRSLRGGYDGLMGSASD